VPVRQQFKTHDVASADYILQQQIRDYESLPISSEMMSKNPRPRSSPPPGLDKPPIPWTTGQTFTVRRHKPPPPFMSPYKIPRPPIPENLQQLTQLEYCLSHQPLEGETCDDTMSFTITKEIRVRDGKAAQVVVTNGGLVAKIYDPLFYPAYINSYT
jgi:hypothetical protein